MAGYRIPGPLGCGDNCEEIDKGTMARTRMSTPGPIGMAWSSPSASSGIDEDTRMLAATAYGEGSGQDLFEEMAAIANVIVKQRVARGYPTVSAFIRVDKTFAYAAHDGNARYAKLMAASDDEIEKHGGMAAAVRAARNALSASPIDYSKGAFFWDGADIKSNYANHPKVNAGIHFTDPSHNIYGIRAKDVPGEKWWEDAQGRPTKLRGRWNYKFESTVARGGTIFWKYNADFLKAAGNKEYN